MEFPCTCCNKNMGNITKDVMGMRNAHACQCGQSNPSRLYGNDPYQDMKSTPAPGFAPIGTPPPAAFPPKSILFDDASQYYKIIGGNPGCCLVDFVRYNRCEPLCVVSSEADQCLYSSCCWGFFFEYQRRYDYACSSVDDTW
jgi:hypothetical protein